MKLSSILDLIRLPSINWPWKSQVNTTKDTTGSIQGDNTDNEPHTERRTAQSRTYLGSFLSSITSFFRKVIDKVSGFLGFENPIDALHRRFIVAPNPHVECTPCQAGIPHEDIEIRNGDVTLRGHLLKPRGVETKNTVIFLNGRGSNSGDCIRKLAKLQEKVPVNILVVNYRGFGSSSGTPTLNNIVDDAVTMYDYLIKERGLSPQNISVLGVSLGGGVAAQLARRREVNTLMLQSSFTSVEDISADLMSRYLPDSVVDAAIPLVDADLDSYNAFRDTRARNVIIAHGTADEVIPFRHGVTLFREARRAGLNPTFIRLQGAGHCNFADFYNENHLNILRRMFGAENPVSKTTTTTNTNRQLARAA